MPTLTESLKTEIEILLFWWLFLLKPLYLQRTNRYRCQYWTVVVNVQLSISYDSLAMSFGALL